MDGPLNPSWVDNFSSVLDANKVGILWDFVICERIYSIFDNNDMLYYIS